MIGKFIKVRENWYEVLDKILVEKIIYKYDNWQDAAKKGFNHGDPQNIKSVISINKYLCINLKTAKTVTIDPDDVVEVFNRVPDTIILPQTMQTESKQLEEINFEELKKLNKDD